MKEIAEIVDSIVPVICPKSECGECDECDVLTKAIEALIERREKPMIEALECAESIVNNSTDSRAAKCLAKIDSILKEAQHD